MFTRPDGLADTDVAAALAEGWGLRVEGVEHLPVGFGGHHWRAGPWFVTADDLRGRPDREGRLRAALGTARALCDAGLGFVAAPVPTTGGGVLHVVGGGRY